MSEIKPHLFISHATWRDNENKRTSEIRQSLFDLLEKEWDVFVDKERLKPGDKWRPAILNSLSNAQAGIILFDRTALEESDWVLAEALIMCFRNSIDPNFKLIPILLDDLKPENEKFKSYQPFQLGEIAFYRDNCGKTVDQVCSDIAEELKKANITAAQHFQGWMWKFEGLLLHIDRDTLLGAWKKLIEENSAIAGDIDELRRAVVQLVHHLSPGKTIPSLKKLHRALNSEQIEKVKNLIKQKWIENESVEIVFRSARKRDKILLIYYIPEEVNISLALTDCLFSRLNSERPDDYNIKRITVADSTDTTYDEAVRLHIEKTITENLGSKAYPPNSENYKRIIRERLSDPQRLTICYIPRAAAKSEILRDLHLSYPQIVFLVQVSRDEDIIRFEGLGGKNLTPALDDDKICEYIQLEEDLELTFND